ncbi:MAG: DNA ligase-associated DEXH box helicase, partial [Stenotrophomonas maltophilia]
DGMYRVHDRRVALRHRLSIGTITSDGSVMVQFLRGGRLGAVEEQFLSRLRPGDRFQFAGRLLELVRLENLTAYVRKARGGDGVVPRWQGGRLPLSEALGHEMEAVLASPPDSPEMRWLAPLLALQTRLSALPGPALLLVEHVRRREGQFVFVYPFAGRQVNEGLAALMALRWTRLQTNTFGYAANDYGFVLAPARPVELDAARVRSLLSPEGLLTDLRESLNLGELARRQFRDIARVSGMLVPALPGRTPRSLRQLQASSGLLYDVLRQHDPDHILLTLAEHEVLHDQLDLESLARALSSCQARTLSVQHPTSLGPLSFPLWAERLRGQLSNEDWKTRVLRAAQQLEKRHGA